MSDPSGNPPVSGEAPQNNQPQPPVPSAPPAAGVSGRRLARALLVLVLLGGGGYLGWTRFDRYSVDRLNASREELGGVVGTLTSSPDEAALRALHERLEELAAHGGLLGPEALYDLYDPGRTEFARRTAEGAAAFLPVVAVALGDLDLARSDLARAPASGALVDQAKRFVEGMAAASPEERLLLRQAFLAGLRGGFSGAAGPVSVASTRGDEVQRLYRTAVTWSGSTPERLAALEAITRVEGADAQVTTALVKLCEVDEQSVADASRAALRRLDPKRLAAALEAKDDDPEARAAALAALAAAELTPEVVAGLAGPIGAAARKPTVDEALGLLSRAGSRAARGYVGAARAKDGEPVAVVRAISRLPEAEQRALVPTVLEILGSLTEERHAYAFELGAEVVALEPSPDVAQLARLLDAARHPECRAHVPGLLEKLGPGAAKAAPALVACLGAERELGWRAARALVAIGVAPGLAAAIDSGSRTARHNAVGVARSLPAVAREVVPGLVRAATDNDDDEVWIPAAVALEHLEAADLVPHLARFGEALASAPDRAGSLLEALAKLGPAARPLLPQVQGWFAAADPNPLRFADAQALLVAMELTPAESVATLAGMLDASNDEVVQAVAGAIGEAGKKGGVTDEAAAPALTGLIAGLARPLAGARQNCSWALETLGLARHPAAVELAVPALAKLLVDPEVPVRINAAYGLWTLRAAAAPVTKELAAAIADADASVRRWAITALANVGEAARVAVPSIVAAVADPDRSVRIAAVWTLRRLPDPASVPALAALLGGQDVDLRHYAAIALALQGQAQPEVVRELVDLIEKNGDPGDVGDALRGCATLGPAAKEALPALEKAAAAGGPHEAGARAAIEAVKKS